MARRPTGPALVEPDVGPVGVTELAEEPVSGSAEPLGSPFVSPLALHGTVGNSGVARLLASSPALGVPASGFPPTLGGTSASYAVAARRPPRAAPGARRARAAGAAYRVWTREETRRVQRELARLRLYSGTLDGILGRSTQEGLVEAFGGDDWRALDAAGALARLKGADRPRPATRARDLRYGELFRDGLLDITFGYGFMEELDATEWDGYAKEMDAALRGRGYVEDPADAARLLAAAGRRTGGPGRFFVKRDALRYDPPAGVSRSVHVVVRFLINPGGGQGAETRDSFVEGMTRGDVAYYSGHGRYGTGPDFDPNFGRIQLLDAAGKVERVVANYEELKEVLAAESGGRPWERFLWRHRRGRISIDLRDLGNVRMNAATLHSRRRSGSFGGRLIKWALDESRVATVTGPKGELATAAAAHPERRYRVLVFDGCRTRDYEKALRATPGFTSRSTDLIQTTRVTWFDAETETFVAFLDGLVLHQSPVEIIKGMNQAMRAHERVPQGLRPGVPFEVKGLSDNPAR